MNRDRVATRLADIVGPAHVLSDAELRAGYEIDWTGRFLGEASFVVRPESTGEVAALVRLARETSTPLVPQGGNTGLVGAAVPFGGAIVVSTQRMAAVGPIDEGAATVQAGAGVTLQKIAEVADAAGLFWPISHAGSSGATVGGTIATNAGGILSWRFGTARHHVRGLEAVLGDGRVVSRLGTLVKDNAGYDLSGLLCGSEGTLGIVTRATLSLQPRPPAPSTAMVAIDEPGSLSDLAAACRRAPGMWAAEVVFRDAMDNACEGLGLRPPFDEPAAAYVAMRAVGEGVADALAVLAGGRRSVVDERVWEYRERQNEAVARAGTPVKLDVSVPVAALGTFAAAVSRRARADGVEAFLFGHLLDGNLHVNLVGEGAESLEEETVHLVVEHGGAVAAEHGIGRARARWLHLARTPDEIAAMAAVKRAFDPDSILNPGVLFL